MHKKFSRLGFFIIFFSISSTCLLFIPYPEAKFDELGCTDMTKDHHFDEMIEFPWRSYNQEIYLYINVSEGKITLQILDNEAYFNYLFEDLYVPYREFRNITELTTTIHLLPSFQGRGAILFIAEEDASFCRETKVSYFRYASSYGFFFLGIAVILFSYYINRRYKGKI